MYLPMMDAVLDAESTSDLSQNEAKCVRHGYSYGFRTVTLQCGKDDVLCVLKNYRAWVYNTTDKA